MLKVQSSIRDFNVFTPAHFFVSTAYDRISAGTFFKRRAEFYE